MTKEEALAIIKNEESSNLELDKALNYFINLKDTSVMNLLASYYLKGLRGYEKNIDKAIDLYYKAAMNGNSKSFLNLGYIYYYDEYNKKDLEIAYKYFMKASIMGEEMGIIKVSDMYKNGELLKKDPKHAYDMLKDIYELGYMDLKKGIRKNNHMFDVAIRYSEAYMKGEVVKKDLKKALYFAYVAQYGFSYLKDIDSLNKLNYINEKIKELKVLANVSDFKITELFDIIFEHDFVSKKIKGEDFLTFTFEFNERHMVVIPSLGFRDMVKNISITFKGISACYSLQDDEFNPIDYQYKNEVFSFYDEESTLIHFRFKEYDLSVKKNDNLD